MAADTDRGEPVQRGEAVEQFAADVAEDPLTTYGRNNDEGEAEYGAVTMMSTAVTMTKGRPSTVP